MKNLLFNLQLMAEEAAGDNSAAETATGEDKATGGNNQQADKKPENQAQQPKYTDEDVNKLIDKKFAEWQKKRTKKSMKLKG